MIEDKIAKFRELIARRDEIDAEIAAFFGGTPPSSLGASPKKRNTPATSPSRDPDKAAFIEGLKKRASKFNGCPDCGSRRAHRKNCPRKASIAPIRKSLARHTIEQDDPEEHFGVDE